MLKKEKSRQCRLIHFVNTDEALFQRSSRCSNSELNNCYFPNVALNFLPVTVFTILDNVFTDVNFRGQHIHVGHVHTSEKHRIQYSMSYKDSCELCSVKGCI